jgi:hypothetical protein
MDRLLARAGGKRPSTAERHLGGGASGGSGNGGHSALTTRCLLLAFGVLMLAFQSTLLTYRLGSSRLTQARRGDDGQDGSSDSGGGGFRGAVGGTNPAAVLRKTRDTLAALADAAGTWQTTPSQQTAITAGVAAAAAAAPAGQPATAAGAGGPCPPSACVAGAGAAAAGAAAEQTWITRQHCHMAGDESELCTYDNAACYDGEKLVVFVPGREVRAQKDHRTW